MACTKATQNEECRPKRKRTPVSPWLSANKDCRESRYIQVGNSLLSHPAFKELTAGEKHFYLVLCMESSGYWEVTLSHGRALREYGIKGSSFDNHVKALKQKGFIKQIGNPNGEKYIRCKFRFVDDWKSKKPP